MCCELEGRSAFWYIPVVTGHWLWDHQEWGLLGQVYQAKHLHLRFLPRAPQHEKSYQGIRCSAATAMVQSLSVRNDESVPAVANTRLPDVLQLSAKVAQDRLEAVTAQVA